MRKIISFFCVVVVLILVGCSSSKIVSAWGTDAYSPLHQKMVVFAIVNPEDSVLRSRMEQHIVCDLQALGYNAYAAAERYQQRFSGLNTTQVYEQLTADTVDAVITVALLNKQIEQVYVKQKPQQDPRDDNFLNYYEDLNKRVSGEGYYTNVTTYFWEGKIYDLKEKELVYMSRSETCNPTSMENMGHEYSKQVVKNMVKKGVLIKQEGVFKPL
ncbi:hypothetical protein [Flavisolibacter tropicus]|nr:hypothetical protein [Flavisolibacter tropicus]